ncbi:MAG: hypothetical protein FJZ95_03435 [Chloroflexi bacterium]|nr:hypothetical protein [Chloroflexota bacterium]
MTTPTLNERVAEAVALISKAQAEILQIVCELEPNTQARNALTMAWCDLCDAIATAKDAAIAEVHHVQG